MARSQLMAWRSAKWVPGRQNPSQAVMRSNFVDKMCRDWAPEIRTVWSEQLRTDFGKAWWESFNTSPRTEKRDDDDFSVMINVIITMCCVKYHHVPCQLCLSFSTSLDTWCYGLILSMIFLHITIWDYPLSVSVAYSTTHISSLHDVLQCLFSLCDQSAPSFLQLHVIQLV